MTTWKVLTQNFVRNAIVIRLNHHGHIKQPEAGVQYRLQCNGSDDDILRLIREKGLPKSFVISYQEALTR